ncbi:hypothetical protein [Streptomyces ipomoeae]|uniref:hypothetical protein n=1 Tax=Streptomyces ipomoeae TaxID=103232 RepID=UPI0018F8A929
MSSPPRGAWCPFPAPGARIHTFTSALLSGAATATAHRAQGIDSSQRLGRHRWTVERTVALLPGCRRPHHRYEREAEHFLAFAGIAAALICYRRLTARPPDRRPPGLGCVSPSAGIDVAH